MRAAAVLMLLAPLAGAVDEAEIRSLVEELAAPQPGKRLGAYRRLQEYGEEILPVLKHLAPEDPEAARSLRALTRGARTLKLAVSAPAGPHPLGGPLLLDVRLQNDTDETWAFALVRDSPRGMGTRSAFFLEGGAGERHLLLPEQVEWVMDGDGDETQAPVLRPGDALRVVITLTGESVPFRRPGAGRVVVGFEGAVQRHTGAQAGGEGLVFDVQPVVLVAKPVEVEAVGRKPAELERALASDDPKERFLAQAEIEVREDDDVLPVLRRHAHEGPLRLAAVRRLGARAAEEDFELVYRAARDPDRDVRQAAVKALGNYPLSRARTKLVGLAQDHELEGAAIEALQRHKHPVTIDLFVRLLKKGASDAETAEAMCRAIRDWTDMPLTTRRSEVQAFERWWLANRARWTRENLTGR